MRTREVCFLIDRRGAVCHADTSGSPGLLADSRTRWEAIWSLRDELEEIAHSHPLGPHAFSAEDDSTMLAIDRALGRSLRYSVVSPRGRLVRHGTSTSEGSAAEWWVELLRLASGMESA